jgi:hypothetical protein
MTITVRGREGRIKVGYQQAARLGPFSLVPVGDTQWQVEATVTTTDAFWVTQKPRTLELTIGKQRWIWSKADLEIGGGLVRGTVTGRPERR